MVREQRHCDPLELLRGGKLILWLGLRMLRGGCGREICVGRARYVLSLV